MTPDKIYNIGIVAHVDAGKTTLTEQMLFVSGALRKAGSVDSKTAQTDFLPIERERGISVKAAQTSFLWKDKQINLIDTPGHVDFASEVERTLSVLDGAILLLSAVEGVQSYTENLWYALEKLSIPTLVFVNKIDRTGSDFERVCAEFSRTFSSKRLTFLPLTRPINEESGEASAEWKDSLYSETVEALAESNDSIADKYLSDEKIVENDIKEAFRSAVCEREIIPMLCGSAQKCSGVDKLLNLIVDCMPSADKKMTDTFSARVFRLEHDKTMGKIAHVRLYGGELKSRDLIDMGDGKNEKITQIRKFNGQKYVDMGKVGAGDIAALCGLSSVRASQMLGTAYALPDHKIANPFLSVKVLPQNESDTSALLAALRELSDEDPLLDCKWEKSEREILISITGRMQTEIISALLKDRYGLSADFSEPSVIYKETPRASGFGYEHYTMPKPCWAVVKLDIEPLPRGSGIVYDGGSVPNNTCFYRYQEHIKRSFFANLEQGPLGWQVTDMKAKLSYAEHHTMHTHPLDFFVATPMAIMNGLTKIGTTLLEPFLRIRISAPSEYLGKVIGDITSMRGEFDTPINTGDSFTVEACIPVAASLDYPVRLASLTHGRAIFFSRFDGYRECPVELGKVALRRGPNPLDRAKWILYARGAMTDEDYSII